MFNFFWKLFGYNINENEISKEEENDNSEASYSNEIEENDNSEASFSEEIEENELEIENFDLFFKTYEDELLSKDELNVIYKGIEMDNVLFNVSKTISQAKYEEFMKILEKTKIEKNNNGNLELIGIISKLSNDNFFEKEYILKF